VRAVKRPTHALAHFLWRVVQVLDRPVASSGSSTPLVARAGRVNPNPEQPIMEAPLEGGGGGARGAPGGVGSRWGAPRGGAGGVSPQTRQALKGGPPRGGGGGVLQVPDWNVFQVESTLVTSGPGGIPPRTEGDQNYFWSQLCVALFSIVRAVVGLFL